MTLPGSLLLIAILLFILGAFRRAHLWTRGASKASVWCEVFALPRRYFHDVHNVVSRDASVARMHAAAAGGFVAVCLLAFVVHVLGVSSWGLRWLLVGATALISLGGLLVIMRRVGAQRPKRLSAGAYELMGFALLGFGVFFCISTFIQADLIDFNWISMWGFALLLVGGASTIFLIPGMTAGPMRHAFAGVLHLMFHPRAERFTGRGRHTALKMLELDAVKLGSAKDTDFNWMQRLSFDACVQCGRCEDVCPAFAAEAPLNPKKLIYDMWASSTGPGHDRGYAGAPYPYAEEMREAPGGELSGPEGLIGEDTIWACTTCRACVEACPMMIEHVDAIMDIRRFLTLEDGATPEKGVQLLENLNQTDNMSGKSPHKRLEWAVDLDLPLAEPGKTFDVLLWLGEGALDLRGQRTLRALVSLMRRANVDFAVLGEVEADCGDAARRLGDEASFQRLALQNIDNLNGLNFTRIVTADPHVLHALRNEYPDLGVEYRVEHHTAFLLSLIEQQKLPLEKLNLGALTYHDPCYLGRYNGEYDAPRRLLKAIGTDLIEMERSREKSFCCGWGGGAAFTDIPSKHRIPDLRVNQAQKIDAKSIAVACPNCAVMFGGVTQTDVDIMDVAEIVALAVEAAEQAVA